MRIGIGIEISNISTRSAKGPFSPAILSPTVWLEPAKGGLFQSNAGATPAVANNDVVGYLPDFSGNAKHYTSEADDTTRPTLQGVGVKPAIRFDGVNDLLRRTESLGLLAAGSYTIAFAVKSTTAGDTRMFDEGNTVSTNTLFIPFQAYAAAPTSWTMQCRNDAGLQQVNPAGSIVTPNSFNGADHVLLMTDDGSVLRTYLDGVFVSTVGWVKSGVFTLNRSAIGALLRATSSNWWAGDIYGMVAVPRVLTATERASLTRYLGLRAGLNL